MKVNEVGLIFVSNFLNRCDAIRIVEIAKRIPVLKDGVVHEDLKGM